MGCISKGECITYPRTNALPGDSILSIHYDAGGVLWIGTLEKGVCRFQDGRFTAVTAEQGLPNNIISHIEEDGLGNFWFNSQNGLFRVSRSELENCAAGRTNALRPLAFGKAEGMTTLAGSGGFTPSGFRAGDGRLWFPTTRGLAVVNPASVRPNQVPPPVLIEEILVDGHRVEVRSQPAPRGALRNPSRRPVPDQGFEVPPGRRQLDIKFAGLSYTSPARVQFKYQLEGLDPDWIEGGTRRQVAYSYLPPGAFTFRVIACNSDGFWNEEGDAVNLIVHPQLWQTWWFKVAAALAVCAGVGVSVFFEGRRRMRRKLERLARAHELERERARIAQDIHDDLGASLTRIGMLSESAAGDWQHPQEAIASLKQIQTTTRELTRAMDEIVWAVNPRHDTLDSLTDYISRFAQDFLGTAHIRCRLAMPLQMPDCSVRSEVRHNLFLAFKETLHNAVKYSGANEVRISFQFVPGGFVLAVADNGTGFDPQRRLADPENHRSASGNGLRNIRSRLAQIQGRAEIQSAPGHGARVELFVPMPDLPATAAANA